MKQITNNREEDPYNKVVKLSYFLILKEARSLLATIEHEEFRYTMLREEKTITPTMRVMHEFISPLLYLRLDCDPKDKFVIHYGFEMHNANSELSIRTASFTRAVYRLTSKEVTNIDIESCVHNDWCITQCSDLYQYVEEQAKHHQFALIKYKAAATKRKQMKAA